MEMEVVREGGKDGSVAAKGGPWLLVAMLSVGRKEENKNNEGERRSGVFIKVRK